MSGAAVIAFVLLLMFIFALAGTFAGVSYTDILGKSLLAAQRHRFFVSRQVLTSLAFLASALTARHLLARTAYPANYMWLFGLAAGLLLVATWGFWAIDEPRVEPSGDAHRFAAVCGGLEDGHRDPSIQGVGSAARVYGLRVETAFFVVHRPCPPDPSFTTNVTCLVPYRATSVPDVSRPGAVAASGRLTRDGHADPDRLPLADEAPHPLAV